MPPYYPAATTSGNLHAALPPQQTLSSPTDVLSDDPERTEGEESKDLRLPFGASRANPKFRITDKPEQMRSTVQ